MKIKADYVSAVLFKPAGSQQLVQNYAEKHKHKLFRIYLKTVTIRRY